MRCWLALFLMLVSFDSFAEWVPIKVVEIRDAANLVVKVSGVQRSIQIPGIRGSLSCFPSTKPARWVNDLAKKTSGLYVEFSGDGASSLPMRLTYKLSGVQYDYAIAAVRTGNAIVEDSNLPAAFQKAQQDAQTENRGLWDSCAPQNKSTYKAAQFDSLIRNAAIKNGLDPALIHAVIKAESDFNPNAISPKGARGLMQLMPATAKRFGVVDRHNPEQNVEGGVRYLRVLMDMFNNDVRLAVAAYNAGENAVTKYGNRIPPYRETQDYVFKVMRFYRFYAEISEYSKKT